jgi:RNA polymerase sigma factor (sigma-70 family)
MEQRLTPIKFIEKRNRHPFWLFKCSCGKEKIIRYHNFKNNAVRSCGCLIKERAKKQKTHGLSHSRFYNIFKGIKQRCTDKNCDSYKRYGAVGIRIEWKDVVEFKKDMYESYLEHVKLFGEKDTSIDRIDNNGNYCKKNCRWATRKEQARNTRANVFIDGVTQVEFCEKNNLLQQNFIQNLRNGWSKEEIIIGDYRKKIGQNCPNESNFKELKKYMMNQFKKNANIVKAYLSSLDEKEKEIVEKRLGIIDGKRHTLQEIGDEYGITRERVRQIEFKALKKMSALESEIKSDK